MKKTLITLLFAILLSGCNQGMESEKNNDLSDLETSKEIKEIEKENNPEGQINLSNQTNTQNSLTTKPTIQTAKLPSGFACSELSYDGFWDFGCNLNPIKILQDRYLIYYAPSSLSKENKTENTGNIYIIDRKTKTKLNTTVMDLADHGITTDGKYLYFCTNRDMLRGGFDVFRLYENKAPERPSWKNDTYPDNFHACGKYYKENNKYLYFSLEKDQLFSNYLDLNTGKIETGKESNAQEAQKAIINNDRKLQRKSTDLNITQKETSQKLKDRTLIEYYYALLYPKMEGDGADLKTAYNLKAEPEVSFEEFQTWYENVCFAEIKDNSFFRGMKNHYSFIVRLIEGEKCEIENDYEVLMEIQNDQLFTESSRKLKKLDLTNWQTFEDEKMGIRFDYPQAFELIKDGKPNTFNNDSEDELKEIKSAIDLRLKETFIREIPMRNHVAIISVASWTNKFFDDYKKENYLISMENIKDPTNSRAKKITFSEMFISYQIIIEHPTKKNVIEFQYNRFDIHAFETLTNENFDIIFKKMLDSIEFI